MSVFQYILICVILGVYFLEVFNYQYTMNHHCIVNFFCSRWETIALCVRTNTTVEEISDTILKEDNPHEPFGLARFETDHSLTKAA